MGLVLVHKEHNRPKKGGGFFLIIFGALLLIIAPTVAYPITPEFGAISLIAGFLIGGLGFYIRFLKKTNTN
jgi:hypothetical protein